ncbi:GNAT family N-acetyltransferase [Actinoplanes nipponensis]|uniref:GNAT family N-acetyltransferase n=1 Tax=Actinoplanes nipponensis TaxID=135950 RepID=UPI0034DB25AC
MTDPAAVGHRLPIGEVLRGRRSWPTVTRPSSGRARLRRRTAGPADHADLDTRCWPGSRPGTPPSPAWTRSPRRRSWCRGASGIIAAAGYRAWPGGAAHLSVLTAPAERGRGLARIVAAAAVTAALRAGAVPQWRGRAAESRRWPGPRFRELGARS